MDYLEIKKHIQQNHKQDTNYCTVLASACAFGLPYDAVHDYYLDNGRILKKGLSPQKTHSLIQKISDLTQYKINFFLPKNQVSWKSNKKVLFQKWENIDSKLLTQSKGFLTVNNCSKYLPLGYYILGVKGHVLALNQGIVQDWTESRKHRITRIWQINR